MPKFRRLRNGGVVAVFAVFGLGPSSVASADIPHGNTPSIPRGNTPSPYFAGYQAHVAAKTVTIEFKIPTIKCTSTASGIIAYFQLTNPMTHDASSGGIYIICSNGLPTYFSAAGINNHFSSLTQTLRPGDTVQASINASSTATTVIIKDLTTNGTTSATVSGPGGGGSFTVAAVGMSEVGKTPEPIPPFSTVTFADISINGLKLNALGNLHVTDLYKGTTLQVRTGPLSTTGNSFTATFVHS